jgi:RHS repeat-associated protein
MTAPGGVVRTRVFDASNRLTSEKGSGGAATQERTIGYDLGDRVTRISAPGGDNVYTYDDRDGLLTATGPSGNATFTYNGDGQLSGRKDNAGMASFGYEKARLKTMSAPGVNQTLDYHASGQLKSIDYGAGRIRSYAYDDLGRVTSDVLRNAANAEIAKTAYEYNVDDQLVKKDTAGTAGAGGNTYAYDDLGRLTSWTSAKGTVQYGWDDSGNRIRAGDKTATYDQRNRLLSDGDYTYDYTARGTLTKRTSSGLAEEYSFDAFDRLVSAEGQNYAYDGLDRLNQRNGTSFGYAGKSDDIVSDGTEAFTRGPAGDLLAVTQGADQRLALTDEHGDLVGTFSAGNDLTGLGGSTEFDPFGQRVATAGTQSSIGFQGDWTDPETDEVNMGARWYSPSTGSFTSRDSVNYTKGSSTLANRYAYGAGDPLANTDPDGHWSVCSWCSKAWNTVKQAAAPVVAAARQYVAPAANWLANQAQAAWNATVRAAEWLGNKIVAGVRAVGNFVAKVGNAVSTAWNKYAQPYVDKAKNWAVQQAAKAKAAAQAVTAKARATITYIANKTPIGRIAKAVVPIIAGVGKLVVTGITQPAAFTSTWKTVTQDFNKATDQLRKEASAIGNAMLTDLKAAGDWVVENKGMIAGIAAGAIVGIGCGALIGWTGVGAIGCAAAAGAIGSLVTDLVEGGKGWKEMTGNALMGATFGAVLGPLSSVAGSAFGAGARALFQGAGRAAVSSAIQTGKSTLQSFTRTELGGVLGRTLTNRTAAPTAARGAGGVPKECNSFVPGVSVLMADGTRKAIEDVRVGDLVLATDPTTGETQSKKVTDLIVGHGEKHLVELVVDVDGDRGTETGVLTATDGHPFWSPDLQRWLTADELQVGSLLKTSAGTRVQVQSINKTTVQDQEARNLTVDGLHTYYVIAGSVSVLVHNCDTVYRGMQAAEDGLPVIGRSPSSALS